MLIQNICRDECLRGYLTKYDNSSAGKPYCIYNLLLTRFWKSWDILLLGPNPRVPFACFPFVVFHELTMDKSETSVFRQGS